MKQKRNRECDEAPAAAERVARARVAPGIDRHAEHEIGRGIFGEETEADTRADQRREAHLPCLDQPDPAIEGERPEQDERDVGGDQQRGEGRRRQRCEHHRRPEADAGAVKGAGGEKQDDGGDGVEDWRRRPHAPFGVAADFRREPDQPGDERGLREIAEGEVARPRPILGLVEEEVGLGEIERQPGERRGAPRG